MKRIIVSNTDSLWKLMSEHSFVLDPDSIHDDLACTMCKELMVDACQTPCGCQYCYKCISNYLANGDNYCPGAKSECKLEYLVLERDLLRDPEENNKIFRSKVLCPNPLCQSKIELSKMEEHMRICTLPSTKSSCSNFGIVEGDQDVILDRLHNEIYSHTELIMNNMKNEFNSFKESFEKMRLENVSLKEALKIQDERIGEIENVKQELRNKEDRILALERQLEEQQRVGMESNSGLNVPKIKSEFDLEIARLTNKIEIMQRKMIFYSNVPRLSPNIDVDFVWKFENVSLNKNQDIFSHPFFYNDYRMCLCLNIKGDKVALWCHIMKGNNDNNVDWPMQDSVTLSIVNQETMQAHKSETYQYATYNHKYKGVFKRPRDPMNSSGIGSYLFIRYSEIKDNISIVLDDSIVVFCELDGNSEELVSLNGLLCALRNYLQ